MTIILEFKTMIFLILISFTPLYQSSIAYVCPHCGPHFLLYGGSEIFSQNIKYLPYMIKVTAYYYMVNI